ncbi:MAG: baseplate J/gp47 family protein [Methylococcaceae bacterium]|jgi:hypothetical protein
MKSTLAKITCSITALGFMLSLSGCLPIGAIRMASKAAQSGSKSSESLASVDLIFSGTPGFAISKGFEVSDGTYVYAVQSDSLIQSSGTSPIVNAKAKTAGNWAIPANSVKLIVSQYPKTYTVSVSNPTAGTPGKAAK